MMLLITIRLSICLQKLLYPPFGPKVAPPVAQIEVRLGRSFALREIHFDATFTRHDEVDKRMATHQAEQPDELTPVTAVTAPSPYPYYARLARERRFYRDEALGLWIAASASAVEEVLAHDALRVRPPAEPVPTALRGNDAGDAFGRFARMTDGDAQRRLKDALTAAFDQLNWDDAIDASTGCSTRYSADAFGDSDAYERFVATVPVAVVATLLGVPASDIDDTVRLTGAFARALAAGATIDHAERAAHATRVLAERVSGAGPLIAVLRDEARARDVDEATLVANAIGFLFQSYDATAGLIGNVLVALSRSPQPRAALADLVADVTRVDPPVHNTRRFAARDLEVAGTHIAANDAILVLLAAANYDDSAPPRTYTFGLGGHACPGTRLACAIATAAVGALLDRGLDARALTLRGYRPLPNARVPRLELATP